MNNNIWVIVTLSISLTIFSEVVVGQFTSAEEKARLYRKVFGTDMPTPIYRNVTVELYIDGIFERQENIQWNSSSSSINNLRLSKALIRLIEPYIKSGTTIDPSWIKGDLLDLSAMRKRGFKIEFDRELFRLEIITPPDIRQRLTISYLPKNTQQSKNIGYTSEPLSGYLNLYSANYYDVRTENRYSGSQQIETSLSWENITWQYEGESDHQSWYNRGARVIIADEDSHIIIGDQTPQNIDWSLAPPPLAGSINGSLFGVGVNKRISMSDSTVAYVSDFYYDFGIDVDSEIMVYINGKITYQVQLPAGRYRLQDLPLEAGFNRVRIDMVGTDGQYNRVEDNYYQRYDMLRKGQWEYDIAAGLPYIDGDNLTQLDHENEIFVAYLRHGLSDKFTLGGYIQYQDVLSVYGLIQQWGTSVGYLTLDTAVSRDSFGNDGWAKEFEWSSDATYSPLGSYDATFTGYGLRTNYFSKHFKSSYNGQDQDEFSWLQHDVRTIVAPFLSLGFSTNTQLSLVAGYVDFHDPEMESSTAWGARLEQNINDVNIWGSFSNVEYAGQRQHYWAINFEWRPLGSSHYVKTHYDSYSKRSTLKYEYIDPEDSFTRYNLDKTYKDEANNSIKVYSEYRRGYDHSKYQFKQIQRDDIEEKQLQWVSGGARGKSRLDVNYIDSGDADAAVYIESGIAFAGDHWGITRPIKDSFTIFYANPGFDGNVEFGDGARIDHFGAAVISDTSSYEINEYKVDATTDVGSLASISKSSFEVKNRYASGTAVGIGSSTAKLFLRGTLVDQFGNPISLKTGKLISSRKNDEVVFFTDQEGKLTVKGVSVGKWRIIIPGQQSDEVLIDILESNTIIFEVGTIVIKMKYN